LHYIITVLLLEFKCVIF